MHEVGGAVEEGCVEVSAVRRKGLGMTAVMERVESKITDLRKDAKRLQLQLAYVRVLRRHWERVRVELNPARDLVHRF